MQDFIYSVHINKTEALATAFNLKFGINEDNFWLLKIDIDQQMVSLGNNDLEVIKSMDYGFNSKREYRIDLVVNDSVAKVFVDNNDTATLVYELKGYVGGDISDNLSESQLVYSNRSITNINTVSGDIFCSGYTVHKVINLSDGNYKLSEDDYTLSKGVININDSYLNTLETDTVYKFRAVTSLTDLDFYVHTHEVGVEVSSLVEKYYRGDNVTFELSEKVTVNKVVVDNTGELEFTQNDELITVQSEKLNSLSSGEHTVKFYTENGRPEAKFSIYEAVETIPEIPAPVNHSFFFIDIAIFAALLIGYVVISRVKNMKYKRV